MRHRGVHERGWVRTLDQVFGATVGAVIALVALCVVCGFGDGVIRWFTR